MFAHRSELFKSRFPRVFVIALLAALGALVFAECGSDESDGITISPSGSEDSAETAEADAEDLEVIEAWSQTLSEGDVEGAAEYFAIPSTAENGPIIEIESLEDAIVFNEALPCGAEVISARSEGEFTTATFRLSERPGGACGAGTGGEASTSFVIEDGKIVEWRRIDDAPAPGDGGGSESAPV